MLSTSRSRGCEETILNSPRFLKIPDVSRLVVPPFHAPRSNFVTVGREMPNSRFALARNARLARLLEKYLSLALLLVFLRSINVHGTRSRSSYAMRITHSLLVSWNPISKSGGRARGISARSFGIRSPRVNEIQAEARRSRGAEGGLSRVGPLKRGHLGVAGASSATSDAAVAGKAGAAVARNPRKRTAAPRRPPRVKPSPLLHPLPPTIPTRM